MASAANFRITITLRRREPGFTPTMLIVATTAIEIAAPAAGLKSLWSRRSAYCEKVMATAPRPPPWIISREAQPKRKATSGWYASRR